MQKILFVAMTGLLISACSEKTEDYYLKNISKAEDKIKSCEADLEKAFKNKDEKQFDKIRNDAECEAAHKAKQEHKRQQRELELKLAAEKKAKEVAEIKTTIIAEQKGKAWQDQISAYLATQCSTEFAFNGKSPKCTAWDEFYEETVTVGKAELAPIPYAEMAAEESKYCSQDKRNLSACTVWEDSYAEKADQILKDWNLIQIEENKADFCSDKDYGRSKTCQTWNKHWQNHSNALVQHYVDNFEPFKEAYNVCFSAVDAIRQLDISYGEKNKKTRAITDAAPCYQANQAYKKRQLGYDTYKAAIE